jgi:hypothetical protein
MAAGAAGNFVSEAVIALFSFFGKGSIPVA